MGEKIIKIIMDNITNYGYRRGFNNVNKLVLSGVINIDDLVKCVVDSKNERYIYYTIVCVNDAFFWKLLDALIKTNSSSYVSKMIEYIIDKDKMDEVDIDDIFYRFGRIGLRSESLSVRKVIEKLRYNVKWHVLVNGMLDGISDWYLLDDKKNEYICEDTVFGIFSLIEYFSKDYETRCFYGTDMVNKFINKLVNTFFMRVNMIDDWNEGIYEIMDKFRSIMNSYRDVSDITFKLLNGSKTKVEEYFSSTLDMIERDENDLVRMISLGYVDRVRMIISDNVVNIDDLRDSNKTKVFDFLLMNDMIDLIDDNKYKFGIRQFSDDKKRIRIKKLFSKLRIIAR